MKARLLIALIAVCISEATAQISTEQKAALALIAEGAPISNWPSLTGSQREALKHQAAAYFSTYKRFHEPYGLTANILFRKAARTEVEKLEGIGDAATWAGHYLAALAFRYSVTGDKELIPHVNATLDGLERVSEVTGKKGFLARFAGKSADSVYQRYYSVYGAGEDPQRPGLGTWAFRGIGPYADWVWLGYPSPDVYIGVNFGLATTYRLLPDSRVRERIARLIDSVLSSLIADSWNIVDNAGRRSPSSLNPAAKAALLRTGATVNAPKYQELYNEQSRVLTAQPAPELCKYCRYYPNNLELAAHYVLATLETESSKRSLYQDRIRRMWEQCSDHLNAYFAALYLSATGDLSNLTARATIQGALASFPEAPRRDKFTDHSDRNDLKLLHRDGKSWSQYALPIHERVPADFLWQRSPCELKGGSDSLLQYPGIDFLLPYWIARESKVL